MPVIIEKTSHAGWPNCYRIANEEVELIVTADVGPRVMRYAFAGGPNLFKEFDEQLGKSGETAWQARGGHRIWVAPEVVPDTYAPDNGPVEVAIRDGSLEATQPVEPETGLEKSIVVKLAAAGSGVEVIHRIRNGSGRPRRIAPWALSMMAPGGIGFTALPPRGPHPEVLAPSNPLVMWAFTDLSDPRWRFTRKHLILRHDSKCPTPQKLGHFNRNTVGAYLLGSDLFLKRYTADPSRCYPDFGCSFEMFAKGEFLELETLGPLEDLAPGAITEHIERWTLRRNVTIAAWTDEEIERLVGNEGND